MRKKIHSKAKSQKALDGRILDLRHERSQLIFIIRSFVFSKIRNYLSRRKFLEVHLPRIVTTSTDPPKDPGKELFSVDWFGQEAFLAQSVQLHKQMMMAAGFNRIYELGPFWRAEEKNSTRHLCEAWSLDIELAFIKSEEDIMNLLENLVVYINRNVIKKYGKSVKGLLGINIKPLSCPFERIAYDEAVDILQKNKVKIIWGEDLGLVRERKLGEIVRKKNCEIFFIHRYPSTVKKFYVKLCDNPKYTRTFDLDFGGWEICSGAQRETNLKTLLSRIKEKGLKKEKYDNYLEIFRLGVPPHGGFGLGVDRLITKILGLNDIKEVVMFPRTREQLLP